jgi:isopentenyl-diphosphate delta-isomerase
MSQRLVDEIGLSSQNLEYLFKFRYHTKYDEVGSENKLCVVYMVKDLITGDLSINPGEISEYRFLSLTNLGKDMNNNLRKYTPWFLTTMEMFQSHR